MNTTLPPRHQRYNLPRLWVCLAAGFMVMAACAEEATIEEPTEGTATDSNELGQALESVADEMGLGEDGSLGQMDDSDEEPAFGSDTFSDEFGEGHDGPEEAPDLAEDETISTEIEAGRAHIVNLMIVWGRIRPNDREPIGLQWDPQLQVNEGNAVRVRRTIRFELGDEVLPQTVRNRVQIQSWTRPHIDGVVVQVALREDTADEAFFRFRSLPVSIEIPARRLPNLNEYTVIDGAGNGVTMVAMQPPIEACPTGFLGGRWLQTRDNGGVFGGEWRSQDGALRGHLAGRYGVDPDGQRLFHGKVINLDGRFLGFLAGTYGEGEFEGEYYNRDGVATGQLHGHYTASGDEGGQGYFRGVWAKQCNRPEDGEGSCEPADAEAMSLGGGSPCDAGPTDGAVDRPDADGSDSSDAPAGDDGV